MRSFPFGCPGAYARQKANTMAAMEKQKPASGLPPVDCVAVLPPWGPHKRSCRDRTRLQRPVTVAKSWKLLPVLRDKPM
ncbi:hypothetical protein GUJ93_ZPchr0002g26117 [Zizania palustris]|uniref:Uncharacterized protein n=1 Tax=Zizania palustris TaxID=103762 RepID=A0A8J5RLV7_ZIZPA|nr:hypothetical protein GUJ93_ZPchr0002g26117 [Zizania palustris]